MLVSVHLIQDETPTRLRWLEGSREVLSIPVPQRDTAAGHGPTSDVPRQVWEMVCPQAKVAEAIPENTNPRFEAVQRQLEKLR